MRFPIPFFPARTLILCAGLTTILLLECRPVRSQTQTMLRENRPQPVLQIDTQRFVDYAVLSPNKKLLLTPSSTGIASLWDVETGRLVRLFPTPHFTSSMSGAISPDGRYMVTSGDDAIRLWEMASGRLLAEHREFWPGSVEFSPDGKNILVATQRVYTLDAHSLTPQLSFKTGSEKARYSPEGRYVLTFDDPGILYDAETGNEVRRFAGEVRDYSADGMFVLTRRENQVQMITTATGKEFKHFVWPRNEKTKNFSIGAVMISPDNKHLIINYYDPYSSTLSEAEQITTIWDVSNGRELGENKSLPRLLSFGPIGSTIFVNQNDTVALVDLDSGTVLRRFAGHRETTLTILNSDDSRYLWVQNSREENRVWDLKAGRQLLPSEKVNAIVKELRSRINPHRSDFEAGDVGLRQFLAARDKAVAVENERQLWGTARWPTISADFSPDRKLVLVGQNSLGLDAYSAHLLDVDTKKEKQRFIGHIGRVWAVKFSTKPDIVFTGGEDGTTRIWNASSGEEICKLVSLENNHWLVLDPAGRFDTDNIDQLDAFNWVMPDDPTRPLPVNVFMRDYYVPRLLPKLLDGEKLKPIANISKLNRAQPSVEVVQVTPSGSDHVNVTVAVTSNAHEGQRDAQNRPLQSGVFDVRLFRDNKLVSYSTPHEAQLDYSAKVEKLGHLEADKELQLWRDANEVALNQNGKAMLNFPNIKLPYSAKQVKFSAYAFNRDRVKSETSAPYTYEIAAPAKRHQRRAYLITIGVDVNQAGWTLNFAVHSSESIAQALREKLSGDYEIIAVPLVATLEPNSARVAVDNATKENIHSVLDILAGRNVSPERLRKVPQMKTLQAATPDDLVIVYMSSHGYVDPNGNFYVIPYDTGRPREISEWVLNNCLNRPEVGSRCDDAKQFLARSISSADLASWWQDVDAGMMIMILDSCYSGALLGKGFRPGPLGDSGFGQLSYDKGMMILASSQPDKTALGSMRAGGRSLLSNALITSLTSDPQQPLETWLAATEESVPDSYKKLFPDADTESVQSPLFFNFRTRN